VSGLVSAYQVWSRPALDAGEPRPADAAPPANAIPSFDAAGRPAATLTCGQIVTWVNDRETPCTGAADEDAGPMWAAAIDGPVDGRVRLALKAGGSAWVAVRPDPVLAAPPGADAAVAAASLARHGRPGQLAVSADHGVAPTLRRRPQDTATALSWTPAQQALARAFATQAAADLPAPAGAWLERVALGQDAQWELVSQVVAVQRNGPGQWWRVRQWLQPLESVGPGPVVDGRTVLALDDSVRSPTLREGWVRHRDTRGRVRAVITDGAACD